MGGVATGGGTGAGGLLGPAVRGFPRRSMAASRAEMRAPEAWRWRGCGGSDWLDRLSRGGPHEAVQAHFFGTHSLAKRCASAI